MRSRRLRLQTGLDLHASAPELLLIACAMATPVLVPPFWGNAAPADVAYVLAVAAAVRILWRSRSPFRLPLAASWSLFLVGGMLALPESVAPVTSSVTLVQDVYLFSFFLATTNLLSTGLASPVTLSTTWVGTSVVVAVLNLLGALGWVHTIFGWDTVGSDGRSMAMFRDPNLAGHYLVVSLFVLWAAPRPARTSIKLLASAPLVTATALTASNTALLSAVCGLALGFLCAVLARRRQLLALALSLLAASLLIAFSVGASFTPLRLTSRSPVGKGILARSLGRLDDSARERGERWQQVSYLLGGEALLGIGPTSATQALQHLHAPVTGEIHNDLLAAFLERGILGGLGAISLFFVILTWGVRAVFASPLPQGWRPGALAGAVFAIGTSSLTLEVLHFRHIWLLFALLASLTPRANERREPSRRW